MRISSWLILLVVGVVVADPAMAQSRRKDDSRRTEARLPPSRDTGERRRDTERATTSRVPRRESARPRPRDDDRDRERDRARDRERRRNDRILGPITVRSGVRYDAYGRRYDPYGRRLDALRSGAYGRVWGRMRGMTCLQLDDELEWAHEEWHWRNDRHRHERWYDVEHARLEWRIAEERAYSNCGRARHERDCRDRGHHARTGNTLRIAIEVLDILLGTHASNTTIPR